MTDTIVKPKVYGQAEVITRKELKPFLKRTDLHGLLNIGGHFALIGVTGWLTLSVYGTWWLVPALLVHGIVVSYLFAPMHECSHGTPFRRRWLNETIFYLVSFIYLVQPIMFRYSHAAHHTYTNIRGWDPDMVWPEKPSRWDYIRFVSSIPTWWGYLKWDWNHAVRGRLGPADDWYVPESEHPRIVREARVWFVVFVGIWVVAWLLGIAGELFLLWIAARLVGEPFMRMVRVSEHWECEETGDLRENTRSTQVSRILYFLAWNMDYHAEHHLAPLTPFHQLPKLHDKVGEKLHEMGDSHPAVHRDVLEAMRLRASEMPHTG